METISDQVSNAGPDATEEHDWRDMLWAAEENIKAASRMEIDDRFAGAKMHRNRVSAIDHAIEALQEAKDLLCR